jgi:hypothetical protein
MAFSLSSSGFGQFRSASMQGSRTSRPNPSAYLPFGPLELLSVHDQQAAGLRKDQEEGRDLIDRVDLIDSEVSRVNEVSEVPRRSLKVA